MIVVFRFFSRVFLLFYRWCCFVTLYISLFQWWFFGDFVNQGLLGDGRES